MFKRSKKILSNKIEMGNYIEGFDVYNSLFLKRLLDPTISRKLYRITTYEFRPDLIAEDFYGSVDYMAILLIQTGKKVEELKVGEYLELVPKDIVDDLINNM